MQSKPVCCRIGLRAARHCRCQNAAFRSNITPRQAGRPSLDLSLPDYTVGPTRAVVDAESFALLARTLLEVLVAFAVLFPVV